MDSEETELETLVTAAKKYEQAEEVLQKAKTYQFTSNGNRKTEYVVKPRIAEQAKGLDSGKKGESSKAKKDKKKKPKEKSKGDKPKDDRPRAKLTKEERNQLRAEGKCYVCRCHDHSWHDMIF
jgi:hypothetical protein